MRAVGRVTLGTAAQLGECEDGIVGSAHALSAARRFAFWNTHKMTFLLQIQIVQSIPRRGICGW